MWKEKQPLPCEECKCCEYHEYFMAHDCDSLECHKYERTVYIHRYRVPATGHFVVEASVDVVK